MVKVVKGLLVAGLAVVLLAGCGANNENSANDQANQAKNETPDEAKNEQVDVVTTASIVNSKDPFIQAVSEKGTWIVAIVNDLSIDQDIVVAGQFHDKGKAENPLYRKLALYAQDKDHKITASYTLTAPKMTVQSENFKIHGGTFKGDVYVEANGFNLDATATIDGSIYYPNPEHKTTAIIDGKVTGKVE